jgi:hypothetical protein
MRRWRRHKPPPQPVPKIVPVRPLGTSLEHRKGPPLHALFEAGRQDLNLLSRPNYSCALSYRAR